MLHRGRRDDWIRFSPSRTRRRLISEHEDNSSLSSQTYCSVAEQERFLTRLGLRHSKGVVISTSAWGRSKESQGVRICVLSSSTVKTGNDQSLRCARAIHPHGGETMGSTEYSYRFSHNLGLHLRLHILHKTTCLHYPGLIGRGKLSPHHQLHPRFGPFKQLTSPSTIPCSSSSSIDHFQLIYLSPRCDF
jgi:hypothetical protein